MCPSVGQKSGATLWDNLPRWKEEALPCVCAVGWGRGWVQGLDSRESSSPNLWESVTLSMEHEVI